MEGKAQSVGACWPLETRVSPSVRRAAGGHGAREAVPTAYLDQRGPPEVEGQCFPTPN